MDEDFRSILLFAAFSKSNPPCSVVGVLMTMDDERHYYDQYGNYQGYSTSRPPGWSSGGGDLDPTGSLILLILLVPFCVLMLEFSAPEGKRFHDYSQFEFPWNIIRFLYYWTTYFPFSLPFRAYAFLSETGLTPFANLNFLLGIAAFVLVFAILLCLFTAIISEAVRSSSLGFVSFLYHLPWILGITWDIITAIFYWVFAIPK